MLLYTFIAELRGELEEIILIAKDDQEAKELFFEYMRPNLDSSFGSNPSAEDVQNALMGKYRFYTKPMKSRIIATIPMFVDYPTDEELCEMEQIYLAGLMQKD